MYYYHPMMDNYGWGIIGSVFWLGLLVLIGFLAYHLLRNAAAAKRESDPLGIAKERYAKGEITKDQFDQLKRDLSADQDSGKG